MTTSLSTRDLCARRRTLCKWNINVRNFYMFIPRILVSLWMPSLQEKSLVIVNCLVNYSGVVKVHIMAKLVCDGNSKSAQHANQFGHNMDHATIVDKAVDYHNSIELNRTQSVNWVRLSSAIEGNRTPKSVWVRFRFRTNRTQSNKSNLIVLNPLDCVRLSSATEHNRTQSIGVY